MNKKLYLRAFEMSDLNFLNKFRNDDVLFIGFTKKGPIQDYIYNSYQFFCTYILNLTETEYMDGQYFQALNKEEVT